MAWTALALGSLLEQETVSRQQLTLYQDHLAAFARLGAVLLAISTDHVWCHGAFARAAGLAYPLLADAHPHGAVARAYGVYDEQTGLSARTLFVLDEHGVIRWSRTSPAAINPGVDGILTALEALGAPQAGSDGAPGSHPEPDSSRAPRPCSTEQPEDHRH